MAQRETPKELSAVKRWLKKEGNSPAILAAALGLKTSSAIQQWFKAKNIPERHIAKVRELTA
jgi:hypothetical protein